MSLNAMEIILTPSELGLLLYMKYISYCKVLPMACSGIVMSPKVLVHCSHETWDYSSNKLNVSQTYSFKETRKH